MVRSLRYRRPSGRALPEELASAVKVGGGMVAPALPTAPRYSRRRSNRLAVLRIRTTEGVGGKRQSPTHPCHQP